LPRQQRQLRQRRPHRELERLDPRLRRRGPPGQLLQVSHCASGYDKLAFTYDGEGQRTAIVATDAAGTVTTTEFRYQNDAVVEERVNGTMVRQFVTDEAGSISKLIVPAGQTDAGTYLVNWNGHGDALNLLRVNGDGSTTLASSFTYDSWGKPTSATHNGIGEKRSEAEQPYPDTHHDLHGLGERGEVRSMRNTIIQAGSGSTSS